MQNNQFIKMIVGALTGLLLAYLGGQAGALLGGQGDTTGWGDLIWGVMGMILLYPLGVAAGIWGFSKKFGEPVSFWKALAGSVAGIVIVMLLAEPLRLNANTTVMLTSLGVVPPVLAIAAQRLGKKE